MSVNQGAQYPKNMGILLRTLPELSFGHALGKGDKNWISECLSKRFCFGFTPIHSLSAEIQPFYVRRRFATSAAQMPLYEKSSWKIEQILCVQWSETKWQIGGGPMFFGYCAPNWLSSQLGNLTTQRYALIIQHCFGPYRTIQQEKMAKNLFFWVHFFLGTL